METVEPYQIVIIVSALIFSAFFSGIEAAFLGVDKLGMELARSRKNLVGRLLANFSSQPTRFITTTLIGNTISLVIYSSYMAEVLDTLIRTYVLYLINNYALSLVLQTVIMTLIVLVVAEFIPKSVFLLSPNRLLTFFALPIAVITYLLRPIVVVTTFVTKVLITHVLGHKYQEARPAFGLTDLHSFIKNTLNPDEKKPIGVSASIVGNLIEFKKTKVRECMVPRTELIAINKEEGIPALRKAVMHSEHSKILVYQDDIDGIIGYCHCKELFKKPQDIDSILTPIKVVSETNLASEVMLYLIRACKSLALVVDEFGGVAGIVSVEDLVEEIVGDIQDEHDVTGLLEQQLEQDTYLLSARHEIDYLNEKYGWDIRPGDYDTLGGFIISVTERIPGLNESVEIPPFTFTIMSLAETHIDTVQVTINKKLA